MEENGPRWEANRRLVGFPFFEMRVCCVLITFLVSFLKVEFEGEFFECHVLIPK